MPLNRNLINNSRREDDEEQQVRNRAYQMATERLQEERTTPREEPRETAVSRLQSAAKKLSDMGYETTIPEVPQKTADDLIMGGTDNQDLLPTVQYRESAAERNRRIRQNIWNNSTAGKTLSKIGEDRANAYRNERQDEWIRGASGTLANSTLFAIPNIINEGVNLAFDWLRNSWNNVGEALGLSDVDAATLGARMSQSLDTTESAITGDDFYNRLVETNRQQAQNVMDKSTSAQLVYPLIDTLGQIGMTAATAGAGAAAGLSEGTTRGVMIGQDLVRNISSSYTNRRDEGQDFYTAVAGSLLESIPTTAIEFSGGNEEMLQNLVRNGQGRRALDWIEDALRSAASEAGEEILQDPLGGIADLLTGQDTALTTGEFDPNADSVFNLARMLQSAGYAGIGSLIAGGAGAGVTALDNHIANRPYRQAQRAENQANEQVTQQATAPQAEPVLNESQQAEAATDLALRMAAGENVAQTEAAIQTEENTRENEIEAFARTLGERGGAAYRNAAPRSGTSAEAQGFRNSFEAYYDWGLYGQDFNSIDTAFGAYIDEAKALQAFRAGQNDAEQTVQVGLNTAPEPVGDVGLTPTRTANAVDQNTRRYLDEMGRALGVEIQLEDAPTDTEGRPLYNGRVEGNTIYLSAQSENNLTGVLNHELTHIIQQRSPQEYQQYRNTVAAYLERTDSGWMQGEINRIIQGYAAQGQTVSREEAIDDIVADAAERFLIDPEAAASTVQTNKSLARRILDAIKDILQRLGNLVRGGETQTRAAQMLEASAETYRQAEEIWTRALSESVPEEQTARSGHHRRRDRTRTGVQPARAENGSQVRNREQLSEDVGADEQIDLESLNQEVAEMLRAGDDEVNAEVSALRAQAQILQNATVSEADINSTVDRLAAEYGAEGTEEAARLKTVVNDAMQTLRRRGEGGFSEALSAIYGAARDAVGVSEYLDDSVYNAPNIAEVRDLLRMTRMYVSPDIRAGWADWGAFRRQNAGRLRMVNSQIYTDRNGVSHEVRGIDQIYMELNELAPEYFPDDIISPEDQLNAMADFWDAIQPTYTRRFNEDKNGVTLEQAEAAMNLTTDILSQIGGQAETSSLNDVERETLRAQVRAYERANRDLQKRYEQRTREVERQSRQLERAREESRANAREATRYRLGYERTLHRYVMSEQNNQRQRERLNRQREQATQRIERVREQNRASRERASERRRASATRKRIERVVQRMTRKLERPSDTQHIPQSLRGVVADFLAAIDTSSSNRRNERAGGATKKTLAWQALQERLNEISRAEAREDYSDFYAVIDPDLADRVKELIQQGVPERISDLTAGQLEELYKVVRAVEKGIIDYDNIRINGQMASATEAARGIIEDTRNSWKEERKTGKITKFRKWDLLDPVRFSDMLGTHFQGVYNELRMGESRKIRFWEEVASFFDGLKKDMKLSNRKLRRLETDTIEVTLTRGNRKVRMTRAQAMSLYLTDKREQGRRHLYSRDGKEAGGGFRLTDEQGRENLTLYQLDPTEVRIITDQLTTEEKALADQLQQFTAQNVSRWGNEASRAVYGYNKFTERNYWPISTDPNWTRAEASVEAGQKDQTIKNLGMTKALNENASNPVMIDSIFNVFSKHATQMAAYGAYLEPIENLNKVINWNTRHGGDWRSVREAMSKAQGSQSIRYLNELLRNINGQAREDRSPIETWLGRAKAVSVAANLRVVAQQPTSILRASAVIPERYILMGLAGRTDTDEFYNTVPLARWKNWGFFGDGVGGSNIKELMIGKTRAYDRTIDKTMMLAGAADDITWKALYRATQHWVNADFKRRGEATGTEAYRQEVERRFVDMIDRTQVVDSVFEKAPALQRGGLWRLLTSFRSEPIKSYNLLMGSARDLINKSSTRRDKAGRNFVKAVWGFASSAMLNALIVSLIDVGRDDDDDEELVDKYGQALLGDTIWNGLIKKEEDVTGWDVAKGILEGNLAENINPLGLVPIVSDIISMMQGYDFEVMGMSAIADMVTSAGSAIDTIKDPESSSKTIFKAATDAVGKIMTFFGVPGTNIVREAKSGLNFAMLLSGWDETEEGMEAEFKVYKATLNPVKNKSDYVKLLRQAQLKGYDDLALQIRNYLISRGGMTRDQIQSQLTGLVSDEAEHLDLIERYAAAYNDNDVNQMQRIANEAEDAGIDGETLLDAAKKLNSNVVSSYADAYMAGNTAAMDEAAAQAERIGVDRDDLEEEALGDEADEEARQESVNSDLYADAAYTESYLYESLVNAILDGDSANESTIRKQLLQGGETEEDIEKRIQSDMKKALANQMGYDGIQDMEEAGDSFDTNSTGYRILHDEYGYTQYSYSDLADAYIQNNGSYDEILEDMLGQRSSGDNVYTEEKVEQNLKSQIQKRFNEIYDWGNGTGWEPYRDALRRLGKSWDEILDSFKRSQDDD